MIKEIFAPKRCGFVTRAKVHVSNFAVGTFSNHPQDERTILVVCTQKLSMYVFLGIHSKVWLRSKISSQVAGVKVGSIANCATNSIVIITVQGECIIYHLDRYDPDFVDAFSQDLEDTRFNQVNLDCSFKAENPLQYMNAVHPELKMELNIWGHMDENQIPEQPQANEDVFSLKKNKLREGYQSVRQGNMVRSGTGASLTSISNFKQRQSALFYNTAHSPRFPQPSVRSHDSDAIPHQYIKPDVKERLLYAINANILELTRIFNSTIFSEGRMNSQVRISMDEDEKGEDNTSGEDSDVDSEGKERRFKDIKMDFEGIDQKQEKAEQGWDALIISTFDGFFTIYKLLSGGYSSYPAQLMCRENQGYVVPLKNWKFPSSVISFSIMGIECSGQMNTRRSSVSNFGGNLMTDGAFSFSPGSGEEGQYRELPPSTFSPTIPRIKTQAQIIPIPEEQEGQSNSPKGKPSLDIKTDLNIFQEMKPNRRKLSSFDRGERVDSFHNIKGTQFFNQTFILVTFISGTSLPFYFSQSQAQIEALLQESKKQGDMINNAQLLRVYALKSFYKHGHEAQVLFLNQDSRYSIYSLSCFSTEIVTESQVKKKIGDVVFTKKVAQDSSGWGVVQAQMAEVPIGEHNGPIQKREKCLIVGLINKEIWFIFKEKQRWKLKVEFPIISFYFGEMKVNAGDSKRVAVLLVFNYTQEAQVFYDFKVPREEGV